MIAQRITKDIRLRALQLTDAIPLFALIERNRVRLGDYFPVTIELIKTPAESLAYVTEKLDEAKRRQFYCFVLEGLDGTLQGIFFLKNINWRVPKCELAYFIDKDYAGKGIMSKTFPLIIDYCFAELKMNRLYLITMANNQASRKLAERCGFEVEGILRNDFRLSSGVLVDDVYYGLIR